MATLFASITYFAALAISAIAVFAFGRVDPKFGALGSWVLFAAIAVVAALTGALGFFAAKRGFEHDSRRVLVWAVCAGIAFQLLILLPPLPGALLWLLLPALLVLASGFAAGRLSELNIAAGGWRRSSPNKSRERTRER